MSKENKRTVYSRNPIEISGAQGGMQLRQLMLADAAELFALIDTNREHLSQLGDITAEKYPDLASVEASILPVEQASKLRFAIRDGNGALVGTVNLSPQTNKPNQMEIGYYIGQEYGGRGYATEAVGILCDWAYKERGLSRIFANAHPDNIASQKVLEKAGFERLTEPAENADVVFEKLRSHD